MKRNQLLVWICVMVWLAAATVFSAGAQAQPSADTAEPVYVTIADENGELALVREPVVPQDADGDGAITVNDALLLAHEQAYPGGAEAGYLSSEGQYGLKLDRLWGVENGGSYGYYVNHASAMSLADPVSGGDEVVAFIYTDLDAYSDTYCYFDRSEVELSAPGELTLTLRAAGWDADSNPIKLPVADAVITVNGKRTDARTDANGCVTLSLAAGNHVISAVSDGQVLVPPVCQVKVAAVTDSEENSDSAEATDTPADTEPDSESGTSDAHDDKNDDKNEDKHDDKNGIYIILIVAGVALIAAVVNVIANRNKKDR